MVHLSLTSRTVSNEVICSAAGTVVRLDVYVFVVGEVTDVHVANAISKVAVVGVMLNNQIVAVAKAQLIVVT